VDVVLQEEDKLEDEMVEEMIRTDVGDGTDLDPNL
jgi:hypothetical protein